MPKEFEIFSRYLVRDLPGKHIKQRYEKIINASNSQTSASDTRILNFALNHPWSVGMLDGGSALIRPHTELRRRLYVLTAILEATPEYAHLFMTQQRSPLYLVVILFSGIRACLRAIAGIIFIKILGRST